jgi:hypothetical protein
MRMHRLVAALGAATLVLWRFLVVGINDVFAIHRSRWIDSSIWLAEDPLGHFELVIAGVLVEPRFGDQALMYVAELLGLLFWMSIAFAVFVCLSHIPMIAALDKLVINGRTIASLCLLVILCGYVGGFYRMSFARLLGRQSLFLLQSAAIITFAVSAAIPVILFVAWHRTRQRSTS